ncbi:MULTISPECIES: SDR family NAD(P)-dependent oxidoreductase [unclassified Sphingomonas]|uniref:SDR family NAD(P)-dependent oxidoreductase n=1 Tax=unclassified Sphingomonas TaxID=196159 RepID=UPI0006FF8FAB|nr:MULTISPECIES: SDR family oxidoreductase [unclassified Sphingomonas]KQX22798.1 3-hydroxyacyl-CoA dehydrogenase [Sphingomonas sp. Root1294]KQY67722.1 3-hydroxyacyl-CoA dehydrogenase [Sphingomonas sp. Root50]KRB88664.1 3-hydroxyacyl-CoA dehydrogenase [Sphingomonas sp. Root720]
MTAAGGHALVTGGSSGIGRAIAVALVDAGWRVTILGRSPEKLEAARIERPDLFALACDVGDEAAVGRAVAEAIERNGTIAVLVNCAGVARTASFEKSDPRMWEELWRTNVMGAVHATRAVLPGMRQLPSARIINIASTASLKGYAYTSVYAATKHALLGLTRSLALELAGTSITANAICPGYTDTDIIRDSIATIVARTGRSETEARATFTGTNPQGRLIEPDEVAGTALWLLSDAARSVTGQAIVVAGGEIM